MNDLNLISKIEKISAILIATSTGWEKDDEQYKSLRLEIITKSFLKNKLPHFILAYRNLDQFWWFIKQKFPTYQERRNYIRENINPVMSFLESFEQHPSDKIISQTIIKINSEHIKQQREKLLIRRTSDPEWAITSARTLLETTCKYILDSNNLIYKDSDDLPKLYKIASESLNLAPSNHTELIFKEILSGCISIVKWLWSLRNKLSDAHGKWVNHIKPSKRHIEFIVNIAWATSLFLLETLENNTKKT